MGVPKAKINSEKRFSDLWERSLQLRPNVVDGDGNEYEVVFPGIRNTGAGPDFRGAVLRRGGRTLGGDVELHLDQSGWRGHGHHTDPAYDGVVLQVVLRLASNPAAYPEPPTAIATFPVEPASSPGGAGVSPAELEELGVERFFAKSAGFRLELDAGASSDQALYQGVMEAMGYARNRKPFLALSRAAPVSLFAQLRDEPRRTAEFGVFAALATAGDMLERVPEAERGQVRGAASRLGARRRMSKRDWSMFRVRPSASPVSRMRAMAYILASCLSEGLAEYMRGELERGGAKALVKAVSDAPGVGRGFALTVVSNALLPCLYAIRPSDEIVSEFRETPAPPADSVTRGIAKVLGARIKPANAAQHSGLHALAKSRSWPGLGGAAGVELEEGQKLARLSDYGPVVYADGICDFQRLLQVRARLDLPAFVQV